jgi:hypothetical protein
MLLVKSLPKIAARVLHNTRSVPQNLKFKFELIATAYGAAVVEHDFEEWCRDHIDDRFPYPITQYLKVIDSRLGAVPEEKRADTKDPRIGELAVAAYELTGILPARAAVAEVLLTFSADEIKAALTEYAENLTDKEVKGAMRQFWSDGGAGAVILARRRRAQHGR